MFLKGRSELKINKEADKMKDERIAERHDASTKEDTNIKLCLPYPVKLK